MSMDYIRKTYGVPAKRGGRVEHTWRGLTRIGTIRSSRGGYLRIQFDGEKNALNYHPTDQLRYLDEQEVPGHC